MQVEKKHIIVDIGENMKNFENIYIIFSPFFFSQFGP